MNMHLDCSMYHDSNQSSSLSQVSGYHVGLRVVHILRWIKAEEPCSLVPGAKARGCVNRLQTLKASLKRDVTISSPSVSSDHVALQAL